MHMVPPTRFEMFDPEEFGMIICPDCNGKGKLPKEPEDFGVCPRCRGFGLIKNEGQISKEVKKQGSDKV